MSKFLEVPALNIGGPDEWILAGQLIYFSSHIDGLLFVPPGFETNLASIPRLLRFIFNRNGKSRKAAIVHDFLYSKKGKLASRNLTRKDCDKIFLEAMQVCGVGYVSRKTMYAGVRVGGWAAWG